MEIKLYTRLSLMASFTFNNGMPKPPRLELAQRNRPGG
jgi:hypothetical protein